MTTIGVLGIRVDNLTRPEIEIKISEFLQEDKFHWLVTLNPEIILHGYRDLEFSEVLNLSDLNVVDGVGIEYVNLLLGQETIKHRYPGIDLIKVICREAEKNNQTVMLFGSQEKFSNGQSSAEICADKLVKDFPNLKIIIETGGKIQEHEGQIIIPDVLIEKINQNNVKVLLVALSNPYQEKFVFALKEKKTSLRLVVGVGGSFNLISGYLKRAPVYWQTIGLEWFWRLLTKRRHLKRVLRAVLIYPGLVLYRKLVPRYIPKVAAFIINKNSKVLVAQRARSLPSIYWQLPQGTVAKNESLKQAVLREVKEEVGLKNFNKFYLCPQNHKYRFPKNQFRFAVQGAKLYCWLLEFSGNEHEVKLDQQKLINYQWVKINELKNYINKERHNTIDICLKYIDRLK